MNSSESGVHLDWKKAREISILVNSVYFFIECVFILRLDGEYKLLALHRGRVLTDIDYKTLKGARIAFSKMYRRKSWRHGVKAVWSPFYNPDNRWLENKTRLIACK